MKYQKLENLESGWKWEYLMKKHREGEAITRYLAKSEEAEFSEQLKQLQHQPKAVLAWIKAHLNPALYLKLQQAIRARRKRHFNAEHQSMRKKSIDLEFAVWNRLSQLSKRRGVTLSETIIQLIEDAEEKEKYAQQMSELRNDLEDFLK